MSPVVKQSIANTVKKKPFANLMRSSYLVAMFGVAFVKNLNSFEFGQYDDSIFAVTCFANSVFGSLTLLNSPGTTQGVKQT